MQSLESSQIVLERIYDRFSSHSDSNSIVRPLKDDSTVEHTKHSPGQRGQHGKANNEIEIMRI